MSNWAVVAAGATTATAAIGSAALAGWQAERRARADQRMAVLAERRAAVQELITRVDVVLSLVYGSARMGADLSGNDAMRALVEAKVQAELLVTTETWAQCQPLMESIALHVNRLAVRSQGRHEEVTEFTRLLEDLGAATGDDLDSLRARTIDVLRSEMT